jgi:hypothetical protein
LPYKVSDAPYGIWPWRSIQEDAVRRRRKERDRMGLVFKRIRLVARCQRQDRASLYRIKARMG